MTPDHPPNFLSNRFKMLMDSHKTATRVSVLVAGKWVQDGLQFLLLLWLARTNQDGFGLLVFGMGVAILIRSVLGLGMDQFAIREFAWDPDSRGRVLGQMIRLKMLLGLLVLGAILAFGWMQAWSRTEVMVVLIISLGQILEGVADTLFNLYRLAGRQVQEAGASALAQFLGVLYGTVVLFFGLGVVVFSCFLLVATGLRLFLAAAIGAKLQLIPAMSRWESLALPARLANLAIIASISFLGSFYNQVQVFLMKYFRELSDVAVYGVASAMTGGVADLVSMFVVGAVLYPEMARAAANGGDTLGPKIRTYFWRLAGFGLGIAFFLATLGGDLLTFIYGPQYTGSVRPLQILGLATVFSFVNNFLIHVFLVQHRDRLLLWFHLTPALLSLVLGQVLIPRLGASGAAFNLLACRATMTLLVLSAAQRHSGILNRVQVGAFLGGLLILLGAYWGLPNFGFVTSRLLAVLALLGYIGWTWRWTMSSSNLPEAKPATRGEKS